MTSSYSQAAQIARDYYNSEDADNFYFHIWGGEDIHIGIYETPDDDVALASRRTTTLLADALGTLPTTARILDIGSGYGGSTRALAKRFGCSVTALNLSERENARNRAATAQAGLAHLIDVVDGSFEAMPFEPASFDAVWSIDALLHSDKRNAVLAEAYRVLKPGGQLIFTDPMESGQCTAAQLAPVLARIHLDSMGSFENYSRAAQALGFETLQTRDLTPHLIRHYARIREDLIANAPSLEGKVSQPFIANALAGLDHWVRAGNAGCLAWGIQHFRKPS
ncbi:MAG: methyltransferase domain-containing protein [Hyphomicrobiaceae bacterium]